MMTKMLIISWMNLVHLRIRSLLSVEMTDFNNVVFDRDDVPAEVVDHITSLENDDSSDDNTDADDTLE